MYVVNLLVADIRGLGHVRLILKTDQEVSLLALVALNLKVMKFKVEDLETLTTDQSVAYESRPDGATEVAVRAIPGLLRTLVSALEHGSVRRYPTGTLSWHGCWGMPRCCPTRPSEARTASFLGHAS